MPKAILKLPEMPESCRECKLNKWDVWEYHRRLSADVLVCAVLGDECSDQGRRPDCPLKLVEDNAFEKQIPKKVITTPDKHKYGYCPVCGRIYWDKCHVGNYCDQCGQRLEVEP